ELVTKSVVIICYTYTEDKRNVFISVEMILFSILATYVYFFLPFFHHQINAMKFMAFAELIFTTIMSLIVSNINEPGNAVIYTCVWAIMSIPVCTGSYYLISSRQKDAVSGLYHMIMDHPSRPPLPSPSKEQEKRLEEGLLSSLQHDETTIDEDLYAFAKLCLAESKFLTYHQVEISTRFIKTFTQPSDLTIALAIYECGLERFPQSPILHILYGLFQGTYMGRTHAWDTSLKKATDMDPSPLAEFFIYQQKGELRIRAESKATGKEMSMVDSMELTHMIRQARRCHKQAVIEIANFWRIKSASKVDENRLQRVVSKITYLEQMGLKILETLRRAYPKDLRILTMYAKFCEDVPKNFRKASGLYALVARLQEVSLATENNTTTNLDQQAAMKERQGNSQSQFSVHSKNSSSYGSSLNGFAASGRPGLYSRKEMRNWINYRKQIQKMKQEGNRWSILSIGIIMVVLVSVSIGQAVWVIGVEEATLHTMHEIKESSFRRDKSFALADDTRQYSIHAAQNNTNVTEFLRQRMLGYVQEFERIQYKEFFTQNENTGAYAYWLDPEISFFKHIVVWRGKRRGWTPNPLNQYDASTEFWRHQRAVLNMDRSLFANGSHKFHESFRFIMDNLPFTYGEGFNLTTTTFTVDEENEIRKVLFYSWVAFGAVCGVLFLIGVMIFRPMLNRTVAIRHKNLAIVRQINQEAASGILAQIEAQKLASQVNANADDDDDQDDDDNDTGNMGRSNVSSSSTKVLYAKLTLMYTLTLGVLASVFAIAVGLNFAYLTSLMRWGHRVDLTLQLRFLTGRVAYSANELLYLDDFIYMPPPFLETRNMTLDDYMQMNSSRNMDAYHNFITEKLAEDLHEFNEIQQVLLFGNPVRGIPRGRLPQELQAAMFVAKYPYQNSNRTTDELAKMMIEDTIDIVEAARAEYIDPNDQNVRRIRDIYEHTMDGFTHAAKINQSIMDDQGKTLKIVSLLLMSTLIMIIVFIYFFVLRRFIQYLRTAGAESTKLLLLIPPDIAQKNFNLQVMIRGREEAIYFFQENNFELPSEAVAEMQVQIAARQRRSSFIDGWRRGSVVEGWKPGSTSNQEETKATIMNFMAARSGQNSRVISNVAATQREGTRNTVRTLSPVSSMGNLEKILEGLGKMDPKSSAEMSDSTHNLTKPRVILKSADLAPETDDANSTLVRHARAQQKPLSALQKLDTVGHSTQRKISFDASITGTIERRRKNSNESTADAASVSSSQSSSEPENAVSSSNHQVYFALEIDEETRADDLDGGDHDESVDNVLSTDA
ncbi:hypothetical protein HK102_004001, partial [Quaeritorhiza haematococci]